MQNCENPPNLRSSALFSFIKRTLKRGTVEDAPRSGRPRTARTARKIGQIRRIFKNKKSKGLRFAGHKLNISHESVRRALIYDLCYRPWKQFKCSKITEQHKVARVAAAKKLRRKYGVRPDSSNFKWKKVINSDFSGKFSLKPVYNSKNSVVWGARNQEIPPQIKEFGVDKYKWGCIIFGALSYKGLIPDEPIFLDEFLDEDEWHQTRKNP